MKFTPAQQKLINELKTGLKLVHTYNEFTNNRTMRYVLRDETTDTDGRVVREDLVQKLYDMGVIKYTHTTGYGELYHELASAYK